MQTGSPVRPARRVTTWKNRSLPEGLNHAAEVQIPIRLLSNPSKASIITIDPSHGLNHAAEVPTPSTFFLFITLEPRVESYKSV